MNVRNFRHGMAKTRTREPAPEYSAWAAMKSRCSNPSVEQYQWYGARGIKVCARWADFTAFYEDMGRRPSAHHSLGRIDNEGDYEPNNCRWEDRAQQNTNKNNNRRLMHNGINMTIGQWSRETGVPQNVIRWRIERGWPISVALGRPVRRMSARKR